MASFSDALVFLKAGFKASRPSFQGAVIGLVPEVAPYTHFIGFKNAGVVTPYTPSHEDLLAEDWVYTP